jgi:hypothetical protein
MAIKFDCLNIIAFNTQSKKAQPKAEPKPEPATTYSGRLKYVIIDDVNLTTDISISEMQYDELGFAEVYSSLQQYVSSKTEQVSPTLGSIYFTPTTVTFRLPKTLEKVQSSPNLRGNNSNWNKVTFNTIGDGFEGTVTDFFNNVDKLARQQETTV